MRLWLIFGMMLVASAAWGTQLATPSFSPTQETFSGTVPLVVTPTIPGGSTGCYTETGSTPTTNGSGTCTATNPDTQTYTSGTLSLTTTTMLTMVASESGFTDSPVYSQQYVVAYMQTLWFTGFQQGLGPCIQNVGNASNGLPACKIEVDACLYASVVGVSETCTYTDLPYTWSVVSGSLPTGLSLSNTGSSGSYHDSALISGTPTASPGTTCFTLQVSDTNSVTAQRQFCVTITAPSVTSGSCPPAPAGSPCPTAPSTFATTFSLPSGTVHTPANSAALTTLLGTTGSPNGGGLNCGDVIQLAAGTTYTGFFRFLNYGNCASGGWIYVISSNYSSLPPPGTRVGLGDAANMPIIQGGTSGQTPIEVCGGNNGNCTTDGANYIRFVGIEVIPNPANAAAQGCFSHELCNPLTPYLAYQSVQNYTLTTQADHIFWDRMLFHGSPTQDEDDALNPEGTYIAVIDSYFDQIHASGGESHGIFIQSSNGPYVIRNNYIGDTTENIFIGGGGACYEPGCNPPKDNPYLPSDFTITDNFLTKTLGTDGCQDGGTVGAGQVTPYSDITCPSGSASLSACSCSSNVVSCTMGAGTSNLVTGQTIDVTGIVSTLGNWNTTDAVATISGSSLTYPQTCSGSYTSGGTVFARGRQWEEKNLLELKDGARAEIARNTLQYNWVAGQQGACILFGVRSGQGGNNNVVDDINFHDNSVLGCTAGVTDLEGDYLCGTTTYPYCQNPGESRRVWIYNNVFQVADTYDSNQHNAWVPNTGTPQNEGILDWMWQHNSLYQPVCTAGTCGSYNMLYFALPQGAFGCTPTWNPTYNVWILDTAITTLAGGDCGLTGTSGLNTVVLAPSSGSPLSSRWTGIEMQGSSGTWPGNTDTVGSIAFNSNGSVSSPQYTLTTDGKPSGFNPLNALVGSAGRIAGKH